MMQANLPPPEMPTLQEPAGSSAMPLRARLLYLHLGSPNPEGLAQFYSRVFGTTAQQRTDSWMCRGPDRCLIFSEGQANTLLSAGYAAADAAVLRGLRTRAAAHLLDTTAVDSELFEPGAIALRDPDGNRTSYGLPSAASLAHAPRTPPARLQHVVVGSTAVEAMMQFYTDTVGFRDSDEVRGDEGSVRACFMRSDNEHHSFAVFKTPQNRLDHHCYEVPDWNSIRDWGDRLADQRIPIRWGPGRHGPGHNLFIFFNDPDGNWLELSTELEVVTAERPVGVWPHEERTLNSWGRGLLRS
jgi:catechol 2,3-dioxygenase